MKKRGKSLKTTIKSKVDTLRNERRQDVRLHQHLLSRYNSKKELRLRKKAEYYASLPKGRLKRLLYRMHPKRVARFIFSREGSIFLLRWAGIGILVVMVATFVVFAYFRKDLPKNITDLRACSQGQKTSYYDRTGEVLGAAGGRIHRLRMTESQGQFKEGDAPWTPEEIAEHWSAIAKG